MESPAPHAPSLARELGLFDATMLVMGGIVGSGIFMNPYVVARQVQHAGPHPAAPGCSGGLDRARRARSSTRSWPRCGRRWAASTPTCATPSIPRVAFLYGWALLLVIQSGGMAAVAVTFARYFGELTGAPACAEAVVAVLALAALTAVNCLGVRAGSNVQTR